MREEATDYRVGAGEMLVLEPGRSHVGYRPCEEETEIYWTHFVHPLQATYMQDRDIPWNAILVMGTDYDHAPQEHGIYIPKYSKFDRNELVPLLQTMRSIQGSLAVSNVLALHTNLVHLFQLLQQEIRQAMKPSESQQLSRRMEEYLRARVREPYSSLTLEQEFHFNTEYLSRCLKKHTGMTTMQYMHYLKMDEAKKLLISTAWPVPLIAETIGIQDYNYFIRLFRAKVGSTPGEYRKYKQGLI